VAQAERFGRALARAGVVVVSGLARGVDQAAHRGALEVGGDTVAVLGSGLNRPWPDVPLVEEIASRGLLLSEFEPDLGPRPHHFPLRNRIISGLVDGLLVIEAAAASGSLITARWAVDQGREVFALPGRVDQPMAAGCHKLLREGAGLVESPRELLERVFGAANARADVAQRPPQCDLERALVGETLGPDELAERLGRGIEEVLVELVSLELAGRVVRAPGGLYRLG
jgi:DNA processing protein